MSEICGNCANRFDTVAHVKACYEVEDMQTSPKETLTPTKNIPIFDPVKKTPPKRSAAKKTPAKQNSIFDPVKKTPPKRSAAKKTRTKKTPVSELKNVYATESSNLVFHSTKTCRSLVYGQKRVEKRGNTPSRIMAMSIEQAKRRHLSPCQTCCEA